MSAALGKSDNGHHFSRRVSFNNLCPEYISDEQSPQSNDRPNIDFSDPNLGYGSALFSDISKLYSYNINGVIGGTVRTRRHSKVQEIAPKSILKNRGANSYKTTGNGEQSIIYHDDALIDDDDSDADSRVPLSPVHNSYLSLNHLHPVTATPRRKSYSEMTDEELIALDPQFATTKSKTNNMDQFKFDSQKTYYLPGSKKSSFSAAPQRNMYPSSNENNYHSISLTVKHEYYDLVEKNRTLLTTISGRRHSWHSIDWLLMKDEGDEKKMFVEDGDHIVVASYITSKYWHNSNMSRKELDENLYLTCEKLLNYVTNNVPKDSKIKVTVELVSDNEPNDGFNKKLSISGSKFMMMNLYKQYHPTLFIIGTKSTNLNFKYPKKIKNNPYERDEFLLRLSSYMVKYSDVPIILIGTNSSLVEYRRPSNTAITFASGDSSQSSIYRDLSDDKSDTAGSVVSYHGEKSQINNLLDHFLSSKSEDRFVRMLTLVSDKSLADSNAYLKAINSKDDDSKIDNKIHMMYKSQTNGSALQSAKSNGEGIYKVKSMISYDEDTEDNKKLRSERKKSDTREDGIKKPTMKKKKSFWSKIGLKKSS